MAPNASDDPWATWASSDESQASGGTAEVSQSSTPGDPASTSAGDGRQGQTSAPAWHNSSSWDVSSNQWSWDSYGYPNWGDAWGQSSWDRYGWWSRPQTGDFRHQWWSSPGPWGKWAYDHDDSGRSGPDSEKQQGSDTSAEAGSHSSEGSARAQSRWDRMTQTTSATSFADRHPPALQMTHRRQGHRPLRHRRGP